MSTPALSSGIQRPVRPPRARAVARSACAPSAAAAAAAASAAAVSPRTFAAVA